MRSIMWSTFDWILFLFLVLRSFLLGVAKLNVPPNCFVSPYLCKAITNKDFAWAYPEWRLVGSYQDIVKSYDLAMSIMKRIRDGKLTAEASGNEEIMYWKVTNWPEKIDCKYLSLMKNARRIELTDGSLQDITEPAVALGSSNMFPVLQRVPEAEVFSFANNKIKEIKADTFKYNLKLREIYLDHNEIASVSEKAFHHLEHLEKLVLQSNKLTTVPAGLPENLHYLDLMDNLCGQKIENVINVPGNLTYLNLCNNFIKNDTIFKKVSFASMTSLCIGDKGPQLPSNLASKSNHLQNLTLSARRDEYTSLSHRTRNDIKNLSSLLELNLEFYRVGEVDFIKPLEKLEVLRLHNIVLDDKTRIKDIKNIFENKKHLKVLSLNGSPDLVKQLRPLFMYFPQLQAVSLPETGLTHLAPTEFADGVARSLQLDIRYNPLHCDNGNFHWVVMEMNRSPSNFTLIGTDQTYCSSPFFCKFTDPQVMEVIKLESKPEIIENLPRAQRLRARFYREALIAGDIIIACLTVVPAVAIIFYLLASQHKLKLMKRPSTKDSIHEEPTITN